MTHSSEQPVRPDARAASNKALTTRALALRSGPILDLSPRTAWIIGLIGLVGVVLVIVGSLLGNRPETIAVDKVLHFSGYGVLAALFVLALRPRWYLPALGGLALLGYLIEVLQPLNRRMYDPTDLWANLLGIAVGAAVGLGSRLAYGYIRTELAAANVRRNLRFFQPGETIVREGEVIDHFYVVKQGAVLLSCQRDGVTVEVARVKAGEMFGLLGEILHEPQTATAIALTPTQLYQLDYDSLIADVGGRSQPIGLVLQDLATDLRTAWATIAEIRRQ